MTMQFKLAIQIVLSSHTRIVQVMEVLLPDPILVNTTHTIQLHARQSQIVFRIGRTLQFLELFVKLLLVFGLTQFDELLINLGLHVAHGWLLQVEL